MISLKFIYTLYIIQYTLISYFKVYAHLFDFPLVKFECTSFITDLKSLALNDTYICDIAL